MCREQGVSEGLPEEFGRKCTGKLVSVSAPKHITFLASEQHHLGKKLLSCGVFILHFLEQGSRARITGCSTLIVAGNAGGCHSPPSWRPGKSRADSAWVLSRCQLTSPHRPWHLKQKGCCLFKASTSALETELYDDQVLSLGGERKSQDSGSF